MPITNLEPKTINVIKNSLFQPALSAIFDFQSQFSMSKIIGIFLIFFLLLLKNTNLTAVFFETGTMPVPTKWQNPTICGSGDPFHS